VLTHGLPHPFGLSTALQVEDAVRDEGAVPATIAVLRGRVHVGLTPDDLAEVAAADGTRKCGARSLPIVVARGETGGTTVSATMGVAHRTGLRVFSTGGIGGVHRHDPTDVSEDLAALGDTPVAVVCSGPKTLLDLGATAERLESAGVPVLGYRCDDMPAFYVGESGHAVTQRVGSAGEAASIVQARDDLEARHAVLLTVPIPSRHALSRDEVEDAADRATREAWSLGVRGADVTPFVLGRMAELSGGRTLDANRSLLANNARVAARLARALAGA
jgi:pseudouridine-5'-phosphate glycosidase